MVDFSPWVSFLLHETFFTPCFGRNLGVVSLSLCVGNIARVGLGYALLLVFEF